MIGGNKKAPTLYRTFVEEALSTEIDSPFKDLHAGMILGKKEFVKDALSLLSPNSLRNDDTSSRRSLRTSLSMEEIKEILSGALGVPKEEVVDKKGLPRNLALYITRRSTGLTNREIGRFFGNISYSAVTKVCQRFEEAVKTDKNLRDLATRMERQISQFKG